MVKQALSFCCTSPIPRPNKSRRQPDSYLDFLFSALQNRWPHSETDCDLPRSNPGVRAIRNRRPCAAANDGVRLQFRPWRTSGSRRNCVASAVGSRRCVSISASLLSTLSLGEQRKGHIESKRFIALAIFLVAFLNLFHAKSFSQDTLKLMSSNLLNYTTSDQSRDQYFRTILRHAKPDILVTQEMTSQGAVNNYYSNVNVVFPGQFTKAPFSLGLADTGNEMYYHYPNPFNPTTTIRYAIPASVSGLRSSVTLKVFDLLGREVATLVNETQANGEHTVEWHAWEVGSGPYFYRLQSRDRVATKKLLIKR